MTPEEITRIIEANGLYHGTISIGVVMDMEHLKQLVQIVEKRTENDICQRIKDALRGNL